MKFNFQLTVIDNFLMGCFLILLLTTLYVYEDTSVSKENMISIRGSLNEMDFGSTGGDFYYPYFKFKMNGYEEYFYCRNCRYKSLNVATAKSLLTADVLNLTVEKGSNRYDVYGIESNQKGVILDIEEVILCEMNKWKKTFYLAILFFLALIFRWVLMPVYCKTFR